LNLSNLSGVETVEDVEDVEASEKPWCLSSRSSQRLQGLKDESLSIRIQAPVLGERRLVEEWLDRLAARCSLG